MLVTIKRGHLFYRTVVIFFEIQHRYVSKRELGNRADVSKWVVV